MKIGLMGFEFDSPNKGCEALTYSFLEILVNVQKVKDDTIIYNFSSTGLGCVPEYFTNFKFIDVVPKIKDFRFNYIKKLKECDVIFDVSMGDSFSDIYSEERFNSLILHKRIAELVGKSYVLLPQTYGPFNSKKTEQKAKRILKKATKIYCRDELSKKMLEEKFDLNNIELTSDMAFILPYKKDKFEFSNSKTKIGINVSGLLYKGGFESENQFGLSLNYKEYIERLIKELIRDNKYEIHLIPHVIDLSENAHDDDYKACQAIQKTLDDCIIAPIFNTPIEAKSYISNMDIFIGSRMHSTIAAFSTDVVTIPVSYSRKFEGLFNSLNYEYVINGKKDTVDIALSKTFEFIKNRKKLNECQNKSFKVIKNKNDLFYKSLNDFFDKFGE